MWSAFVESDTGETLAVIAADRINFGKPLLSFQAPLDLYCSQDSSKEEEKWFSKLDEYLGGQLCTLVRPFLDSLYSGNWDYAEDEYEFFNRRMPAMPLTEEKFKQGLERAKSAWVDIEFVIIGVERLLAALKATNLESTTWYDSQDTIAGFEALSQTLSLLARRGATEVRIRID